MNKNILIVGGNPITGKESSIIDKISVEIVKNSTLKNYSQVIHNGVFPKVRFDSDLILWFPDISNDEEKNYYKKDKGAVLICSKVMREGYSEFDAISRIFKMNGNAVVAIYKDDPKKMRFKLIDALGNCWIDTFDISMLCVAIIEFYKWTKKSVRISLSQIPMDRKYSNFYSTGRDLKEFIETNNKLSDKVVEAIGKRFFGNLSTRCMKLFPTTKQNEMFFISPRNVDKSKLTQEDFVLCDRSFNYYGDRKPSVDSPIQIELYNKFPEIKYMIHGHCFILDAEITSDYVPCGDMREVDEILNIWKGVPKSINLKNHGFLMIAESLEEMKNIVDNTKMVSL